ncbi:hypothetical protein PLICRDRAFT_153522 [Plicaturopsis crispa FD-325 SS-3]|nr:hypothetical protein PLICRDRAFT_153522 [Plicaturopsis crispa FD-325 SS-3]
MFSPLRSLFKGHSPIRHRYVSLRLRTHLRQDSPRRFAHSEDAPWNKTPIYSAKRKSLLNVTLLVIGFVPIFTFGLGTWQLQRLQWKIALIDELGEKLQRPPISLPKQINISVIPEFVYRRVLLRGKWDHTHSILLGPRVREGVVGYHVVTPLVRSDGSTVLVDRGFVSKAAADGGKLRAREDSGEVEVLGMLRTSQTRNNFTPDNHPEQGVWHWADVDAIADYAGGAEAGVQPVFLEQIFEGHGGDAATLVANGIPIGRAPTVDLRNAHLSYVITWYSLSAFTAVMFARLLIKRRQSVARPLPR